MILASCLLLREDGAAVMLVTDDRNLRGEAADNGLEVADSQAMYRRAGEGGPGLVGKNYLKT